jgi:hypothetical protein
MITDVFHKRYPHLGFSGGGVPKEISVLFRQGIQIIFQDLKPNVRNIERLCHKAYDKLVRELGHGLYNGHDAEDICVGALCEPYDLWNDAHGNSKQFIQYRLSLLELLLSEVENEFDAIGATKKSSQFSLFSKNEQVDESLKKKVFRDAIIELNHRFREARVPFHYHNGIFQLSNDDVIEEKIYEPFWIIVKDPRFHNVDIDIKEAIDRRDNKGRDAVLYALKALESTIKIISDDKGWTRGTERGAANYIDNLVSASNGRFIDVWEAENLKALFRELRNPHGHGPGLAPQPTLTDQQIHWVIECSLIWIKSLVTRI